MHLRPEKRRTRLRSSGFHVGHAGEACGEFFWVELFVCIENMSSSMKSEAIKQLLSITS